MSHADQNTRGFTLVEVSILLTVVAILSAVIAPVLSRSLADTRLAAAHAEMAAISQALRQFLDDIGCEIVPQNRGPVRSSLRGAVRAPTVAPPVAPPSAGGPLARGGAALGACSAAEICNSDPVELLVSAGDIPALGPDGDSEWVLEPDGANVDFLEYFLISNTPGNERSRAFPSPGEGGDRRGRAVDVGKEIEAAAVGPGVAGEDVERLQFEVLLEPGAGLRHHALEDPAHGEHGGPRIDGPARDIESADPRTERPRAVEDRDAARRPIPRSDFLVPCLAL